LQLPSLIVRFFIIASPQPKTAISSPGSISALSAAIHPVGKMSEIMIACSSETSSGSFTRLNAANGTRAVSVWRPSNPPASSGPP